MIIFILELLLLKIPAARGQIFSDDNEVSDDCASCVYRPFHSWDLEKKTCSLVSARCGVSNPADCPQQIDVDYAYNDSFARHIMFPLAAASAADNPTSCLSKAHAELVRQVTRHCDAVLSTCSGIVAKSHRYKAIIVAFRGSNSYLQMLSQLAETTILKTEVKGGGKVGAYYDRAFKLLWSCGLQKEVKALKCHHPDYEIWVTGISMGAALATLAAREIAVDHISKPEDIRLMTFGEPRVFDRKFSEVHDKMLPYTYRVVHEADLIPHLAPKGFNDYYHHRYEVWYDNDMSEGSEYTICQSPEDCRCSNSKAAFSLRYSQHFYYFNVFVYDFIDAKCEYPKIG